MTIMITNLKTIQGLGQDLVANLDQGQDQGNMIIKFFMKFSFVY